MATGSITGGWGIVRDVEDLLKKNLQTYIDEVMASDPRANFVFKAPNTRTGYTNSPTHTPRDRFSSIAIWVDSEQTYEAVMNALGPRTEQKTIGILWYLFSEDPSLLEQKKQLGTAALKRLIWKRWRADFTSSVVKLDIQPVDFRFSSLRMRGGSSQTLKGYDQDSGDNIDAVIVGLRCLQRVDAPVDFA